ncbi:MAG: cytochrome ubiquinol oxidase subunit I [Gammaproteobacteria bacterium]|nr:cytochrome ubiquinol oxidase subunit I [Gammaproteobacteria bacterium]
MDPLLLSRIQFVANITFHILFPAITIALSWVLLFFKLCHNKTKDPKWNEAYQAWVKVFALSFALGAVSGITMPFQFGTNWPGFMETVGNIAGPFLAYEVLTAFFLEATFLGIMLFAQNRVPNWVHTLATVLVAIGTLLSAFWILALNSWMQTPTGFEMIEGKAHATDWMAIVFNPSMPYRLIHMLTASGLTVAFLIAGISAYRTLRGDKAPSVQVALKTGIVLAALLTPLQIFVGDQHGLNTFKYQPAKVAAIEGVWETERGIPAIIFALPDEATRQNRFAIQIPKLSSWILTYDWNGEVRGLNTFGKEHPPVALVFWAFRIMVGIGLLMLFASWTGVWQLIRHRELKPWFAKTLVWMTFSGWFAVIAGWYTTEIGRQPWLVSRVLTTAEAVSHVPSRMIGLTLTLYLILYVVLLAAFISVLFYMARQSHKSDLER